MPKYTWDDWEHMLSFLSMDFNARSEPAYKSAEAMMRYFMECKYSSAGEGPYNRALHVMFDMPFEDLPTVLNEEIFLGSRKGTLMIHKIAEWRLLLGK